MTNNLKLTWGLTDCSSVPEAIGEIKTYRAWLIHRIAREGLALQVYLRSGLAQTARRGPFPGSIACTVARCRRGTGRFGRRSWHS
jgi:hypothetical protein